MKKKFILYFTVLFVTAAATAAFAQTVKQQGPKGPNPCSGDGIPDGSCFPPAE